jgi:hypothetical protein
MVEERGALSLRRFVDVLVSENQSAQDDDRAACLFPILLLPGERGLDERDGVPAVAFRLILEGGGETDSWSRLGRRRRFLGIRPGGPWRGSLLVGRDAFRLLLGSKAVYRRREQKEREEQGRAKNTGFPPRAAPPVCHVLRRSKR